MRVKITDREKVMELLNEAEGRAKLRKIESYENLQAIVKKAENWLMDLADTTTPKVLSGTKGCWTAYEHLPNAYYKKGTPEGTYVRWYWGADGVARITEIGRREVKTVNHCYDFDPSEKYSTRAFQRTYIHMHAL